MNSNNNSIQQLQQVVGNHRFQSFAVAAMVLITLVVIQVGQFSSQPSMVEIYSHCRLQPNDIQRIQNALSQSGLSEFEFQNKRLLVPKSKLAAYLNAIAQHDATPDELRDSTKDKIAVNPFQSRAEKQAREQAEKKTKICKMVCRLPFIEQAWLEIDLPGSHSVFEKPTQSAVISIRSTSASAMTPQNIETVKQLIGAAYARLQTNDIVVIDLNAGIARTNETEFETRGLTPAQQIATAQQEYFREQIRSVLDNFPEIEITVLIQAQPIPFENQIADTPSTPPQLQARQVAASTTPGANGFASIKAGRTGISPPNRSSTPSLTPSTPLAYSRHVSVSLDVPQSLVLAMFPGNESLPPQSRRSSNTPREDSQELQRKFSLLSAELIQKIRPVLPESAFKNRSAFPISVHLIREPIQTPVHWTVHAKLILTRHWPSIAVMLVGLMLFTIISRPTRNSARRGNRNSLIEEHHKNANNNPASQESHSSTPTPAQLSSLIDRDPDAAAKILESWIQENE